MRHITQNLTRIAVISVVALALTGCATHSRKHNNTLIGAGLGGAAGAVLTQGDPLFTLGGAAAGGVLGNILTDDDRSYRSSSRGRNHASPNRGNSRWSDNRNSRGRGSHHSRRR